MGRQRVTRAALNFALDFFVLTLAVGGVVGFVLFLAILVGLA